MNPAARPVVSERELLLGVALVALLSGTAAALRLTPERWSFVCLVAVIAFSATSLIGRVGGAFWRWISPIAILAACSLYLLQQVLAVRSDLLTSLTWTAIVTGVACLSQFDVRLALAGLVGSAALGFAFVALSKWGDGDRPFWSIQVLAAAAAAAALGLASITLRISWKTRSLTRVPAEGLLLMGSLSCMMASVDGDSRWTVAALMLFAATMLHDHGVPEPDFGSIGGLAPGMVWFSAAALSLGAAATVGVIAADELFPLSLVGSAMVGMLSAGWLAHRCLIEQSWEISSMREAARESRVDPLTELLNRRGLAERMDEEIARASRFGHPLSVIMLDIDDFKRINDAFGHGTGDLLLQMAARSVEQSIRSIDIAGRLGGDEFVVLLPETSLDGAGIVADRIRQRIATERAPMEITCSLGIAELGPLQRDWVSLLDAADTALYAAKVAGKNRIELSV